ncbi:MAG: hydantoinase/oxoprolinase family protein [Gammaproteobacteria bacterium]
MPNFLCGLDIGGTFTDCVIVDERGEVVSAKAPSTPGDFAEGLMQALQAAAQKCQQPVSALLSQTTLMSHGTTVGTNAIVQKRGAKVGLITTQGHNDVIHIMRGSRGLDGREVRKVVHIPESSKPTPIVPKRLIRGVSERVDCFGNVVVALNEAQAEQAIGELLAQGVEAIAICFLWSFLEPAHERRVKAMVLDQAADLFVTCSHELVPKWGEYERTTASCLNAYVGPVTTSYLTDIEQRLERIGYGTPLQITQSAGGTIPVSVARHAPLLTLDSGPVAGVMGSRHSAAIMGYENVITTDMGGTSFDIGVIYDGEPAYSFRSKVHQYEYYLPKVDIQAIGSGGGSKVWLDEITGTLRVGPESAGAVPGPVCYARGGTVPTVTDADLVLGYLNPDNFAGGSMPLDVDAARSAIGDIAARLNMDIDACASGITRIVEFQMADLIRKATIQKGFDPRDFVVFAFGGAGPVHAGMFAAELGVRKVIVPQRATASVWCAFGAASVDLLHIYEQVDIMLSPFDVDRINGLLESLRERAQSQLLADGVPSERHEFRYALDMRHKGQIHEVEVELEDMPVRAGELGCLHGRFTELYERLYGGGSSLAGARLEIVTGRCRASAATPKPTFVKHDELTTALRPDARLGPRSVYWPGDTSMREAGRVDTPIYDGHRLVPGNRIEGPAVVELETTTVVVHPEQTLLMDAYGNFEMSRELPTGDVR